jgi:hypothetical protein
MFDSQVSGLANQFPYDADARNEPLPFTIRLVSDESALQKAVKVRHSAYARHVPDLAATMIAPESYDAEPGTVVLLAESRFDGQPLGTMRIATNRFKPLTLESSVDLPTPYRGASLATAARLGVALGRVGAPVKTALFKAYYAYCVAQGIDWMVIAARRPLDRQYSALLFHDIFPERGFIPLAHAQNIPHRLLALDVAAVKGQWARAGHPLYDYIYRTVHADIRVDAAQIFAVEEKVTERITRESQALMRSLSERGASH